MSPRCWYIIGPNERDPETGEPLYWSNVDGWVGVESANRFCERERWSLNLPIGGKWVRL